MDLQNLLFLEHFNVARTEIWLFWNLRSLNF